MLSLLEPHVGNVIGGGGARPVPFSITKMFVQMLLSLLGGGVSNFWENVGCQISI